MRQMSSFEARWRPESGSNRCCANRQRLTYDMRYAVVIEKAEVGYSAYVPDLPGCVAAGPTVKAVEREVRDAIRFHIDGLEADGAVVPAPTSIAEYVDV
jgi:predicted RNase H-like HicB family nuclease